MGYYSVIILKRVKPGKYQPEGVYFGEVENMMKVKLYEAIRLSQNMPSAEFVVVWHDLEQIARVHILH